MSSKFPTRVVKTFDNEASKSGNSDFFRSRKNIIPFLTFKIIDLFKRKTSEGEKEKEKEREREREREKERERERKREKARKIINDEK